MAASDSVVTALTTADVQNLEEYCAGVKAQTNVVADLLDKLGEAMVVLGERAGDVVEKDNFFFGDCRHFFVFVKKSAWCQ